MADLTLTEALELAKSAIVEDEGGGKWIRIDALKQLEASRKEEQVKEKLEAGPTPKTYDQAKLLAHQDQELRESFADRPPVIGPTPPAIEGVKS